MGTKKGRPSLGDAALSRTIGVRFTEGGVAEIDAMRYPGEDRPAFVRKAVEREIRRRK